jgi:two-component system, cell cycle sensor histidine kinase and response regulator CckA
MLRSRSITSLTARALVVAVVTIGYVAAVLLFRGSVPGITTFVAVPIVLAGWAFGVAGGAAATVVGLFALNPLLRVLQGQEVVFASWVGTLVVLFGALMVGHYSDLQRRMQRLLAEREAAEAGERRLLREQVAREAAEQGRRRLEQVLESITDGFLGLDREWRLTYVNQRAEQAFQRSRDELLGRPFLEVVDDGLGPTILPAFERALRERCTVRFDYHHPPADAHFAVSVYPAEDGVSVYFRNVTHMKQSEAALAESEYSYRTLFDSITEAVYIHDLEGRFLSVNRAVEAMYGYTAEELIGQTPAMLTDPGRNAMESVQEYLARARTGEPQRFEWWSRRKNGESFPKEITLTRGRYFGSDVLIGVARDLSEQKSLAEQLRQAQKMEAIGRLAGGIAHDFNNLLTAIKGNAEMLLMDDHDAEVEAGVQEIAKAADRASSLTRQLLAFSRKQVMKPRVISVDAAVREMAPMLSRLIGADIELRTVLEAQLGAVLADPTHVEQILLNLAVNARDAMPEGGKLTIETTRATLDESYARHHVGVEPGKYVMLAVSDTGMGMDAQTRARIFEPFFTTKEEGKGTGLGLATVYGVVQQSGGHIWVYSEPGKGTTFKIYFPETGHVEQPPATPAEPAAPVVGTETILLVEDEAPVREFARSVLERSGFSVVVAESPDEALAYAATNGLGPDLLVTDVGLPTIGGRRLAQELRGRWPQLLVLFTSGYPDEAVFHHGMLERGTQFLQKPFSPDALARKARSMLDLPQAG